MAIMKKTAIALGAALALCVALPAQAQEKDQFVSLLSYRVGPYGNNGISLFGGWIDYMKLVNAKGGVNGVMLSWEECETEYNNARGVECYERLKTKSAAKGTLIHPVSTGISYSVLEKTQTDKVPLVMIGYGRTDAKVGAYFPYAFPLVTTYQMQASAMLKFMAIRDKGTGTADLKGKKVAFVYHDSAYGKEPFAVFEAYAKQYGFELIKLAVPHPGNEQQSQWLQIRQAKPDYVILWGWGVMNAVALKTAQRNGYPSGKILGVWWAGSEEDVIPAGSAANGYTTMTFKTPGNYPLLDEIKKKVYAAGKGNLEDKSRIGSTYHMRGVTAAILWTEAVRKAQEKYGKGKVLTSELVRWGFENLNVDEARLKALGAFGMMPPVKTTCLDHEGSGAVKVQRWDGKSWKAVTPNWVVGDKAMIRKMQEESAAKYATEKKITPRDCSKEG